MDKSILRRIGRVEDKVFPVDGVGLLELQPDSTWALIEDGRVLGRYATEKAGTDAFRGTNLIIIDI